MEEFKDQYEDAILFLQNNIEVFQIEFAKHETNPEIGLSIIFPELVRYSYFKDLLETTALSTLYTNGAKVDFSIGQFQMKPSFVEKLEMEIKNYPDQFKEYKKIRSYSGSNEKEIRKERVERLQNMDWQLEYLNCFCAIIDQKIDSHKFNTEELIRIYATAYNYDFQKNLEEINRWQNTKTYPYGMKAPPEIQYSYAEVAIYFYKNDIHKILNN